MNYKLLLTKYIEHVGEVEGYDFIPKTHGAYEFTEEELEALWECAKYDPEKRQYHE